MVHPRCYTVTGDILMNARPKVRSFRINSVNIDSLKLLRVVNAAELPSTIVGTAMVEDHSAENWADLRFATTSEGDLHLTGRGYYKLRLKMQESRHQCRSGYSGNSSDQEAYEINSIQIDADDLLEVLTGKAGSDTPVGNALVIDENEENIWLTVYVQFDRDGRLYRTRRGFNKLRFAPTSG